MPTDHFTSEVENVLHWYVYRLLDPRNGETFYVGKGKGNRVFTHAKGLPDNGVAVSNPVLHRIKEIQLAGLEVSHVVHRHGISTEWVAYEVEAALIDVYPGALNRVAGHGSDKYGCRHADEIVAEFEAEEFEVTESLMCICINSRFYTHSTYDAVRGMWPVNLNRTLQYNLVLAHVRGLVVGAYLPNQPWLAATPDNFPEETFPEVVCKRVQDQRRGFDGKKAGDSDWDKYVGKRVPERYRTMGARFPVRYIDLAKE
jgi:hypothetical protein